MKGATAAVLAAGIAALAGLAFVASMDISVRHECEVRFFYEDGQPVGQHVAPDEQSRERRYVGLVHDFGCGWYPCPFEERVSRCKNDPQLKGESESRIRSVLASMEVEVVGMACTNYVYPCRLVLSDAEPRKLDLYAGVCMDLIRERVAESNKLREYRAVNHEYQRMCKLARRIKELEDGARAGNGMTSHEPELDNLRQTVNEIKRNIDETRMRVAASGLRRITFESKPHVRRIFGWADRSASPVHQ